MPSRCNSMHTVPSDGPKMADLEMVGEVLKEDAVDELLEQCSHISDKLRNALGNSKGTGS